MPGPDTERAEEKRAQAEADIAQFQANHDDYLFRNHFRSKDGGQTFQLIPETLTEAELAAVKAKKGPQPDDPDDPDCIVLKGGDGLLHTVDYVRAACKADNVSL